MFAVDAAASVWEAVATDELDVVEVAALLPDEPVLAVVSPDPLLAVAFRTSVAVVITAVAPPWGATTTAR